MAIRKCNSGLSESEFYNYLENDFRFDSATNSLFYSWYKDDIYNLTQGYLNGKSFDQLYDDIPTTIKLFMSSEDKNMLKGYYDKLDRYK